MSKMASSFSRVAAGTSGRNDSGLKTSRGPLRQITVALHRARYSIALSAATYLISLLLGIAMVSAGVPVPVQQRDSIVNSAQGGPTIGAYNRGDRLEAALLDFGSNLVLGAGTERE